MESGIWVQVLVSVEWWQVKFGDSLDPPAYKAADLPEDGMQKKGLWLLVNVVAFHLSASPCPPGRQVILFLLGFAGHLGGWPRVGTHCLAWFFLSVCDLKLGGSGHWFLPSWAHCSSPNPSFRAFSPLSISLQASHLYFGKSSSVNLGFCERGDLCYTSLPALRECKLSGKIEFLARWKHKYISSLSNQNSIHPLIFRFM